MAKPTKPIEIYTDIAGLYRWRLKAANGQIVAGGQQGYKSIRGIQRGIHAVAKALGIDPSRIDELTKQ